MAVDTFMVYIGVYDDVADAEADYDLVKELHTQAGLIDAYDAVGGSGWPNGPVRLTNSRPLVRCRRSHCGAAARRPARACPGSTQDTGRAWTDSGATREDRSIARRATLGLCRPAHLAEAISE
jgi:hypothetical protein